ncbi:hypothetical protein [Paenibacillus sp. GCM10023250]
MSASSFVNSPLPSIATAISIGLPPASAASRKIDSGVTSPAGFGQ